MRGMSSSALILLLAVATMAVVSSCGGSHRYPQELSAVDSICKDSAEVAMSRLQALSAKYDQPSADAYDRNYYLLLKVKAANNAYQPLADSTIFHVLDFFRGTAEKDKLCQSYYYLGKYYIKKNDAPQGLENFQKALDLTDENTPLYFRSCIYNQMGKQFLYQGMYDKALVMYKESYSCDSIQKDSIGMLFGMRDIASLYSFKKDYPKSLAILKEVYRDCKRFNANLLQSSISHSLAVCYDDMDDEKNAKRYLYETLSHLPASIKASVYGLAADIYHKENRMDSVYHYSSLLIEESDIYGKQKAAKYLCQYYLGNRNNAEALFYNNEYKTFSDSINEINAVETVAKMNAVYNSNKKEKEKMQLEIKMKERTLLYSICVSFFLLGMAFFIYRSEKNKKKYLQFKLINENLKKILDDQKSKEAQGADNAGCCPDENSVTSKETCETSGVDSNNDKVVSYNCVIVEAIQRRIEEKKNLTAEDWKFIDLNINKAYPGFKEKLYSRCNLKSSDYKICILVKLEFQNLVISILMNRSEPAVSLKRAKLYFKLTQKEGKAKDFNDFIKSL